MQSLMKPEELWQHIKDVARSQGIVDIAVASAESWVTDGFTNGLIPEGSRPTDILPDARSVIVFGIPIQKTIIDTTPSIYYNHLYNLTNQYLDLSAERLVLELNILGHHAVYVPRDGYHGITGLMKGQNSFFSHRHAAYLAGMGSFGYNNMLLTEKYGPRVRITSIITSAELPAGKPMEKQLCTGCRLCTRMCPAKAVPDEDYPLKLVDKQACTEYHKKLSDEGIMPCGKCIAVCPVGNDRHDPKPDGQAMKKIQSYRLVHNEGD